LSGLVLYILVFWFYIKPIILKVEGPIHDSFGNLHLDWGLQPIHSEFAKFDKWSYAQPWSCLHQIGGLVLETLIVDGNTKCQLSS
jgi:hypothetical protein